MSNKIIWEEKKSKNKKYNKLKYNQIHQPKIDFNKNIHQPKLC